MPRYVSIEYLRKVHGADFLVHGTTGDEIDDVDVESATRAIADAEAKVDSYIGVRNTLPLPGVEEREDPENNANVPEILRSLSADIALYRAAATHDQLTDEKRKRYDDAISWLEQYAQNEVSLGIEVPPPSSGGVTLVTAERVMTRAQTGGLL